MTSELKNKQVLDLLAEDTASRLRCLEDGSLLVEAEELPAVAGFIKSAPGLEMDYLCSITGVDYNDYFELVYLFYSINLNHCTTLKVRICDKNNPAVPTLTGLWLGADLQEREIYDLLGITFDGHLNMKRIFLWEGFSGYPLRKDFRHGD